MGCLHLKLSKSITKPSILPHHPTYLPFLSFFLKSQSMVLQVCSGQILGLSVDFSFSNASRSVHLKFVQLCNHNVSNPSTSHLLHTATQLGHTPVSPCGQLQ